MLTFCQYSCLHIKAYIIQQKLTKLLLVIYIKITHKSASVRLFLFRYLFYKRYELLFKLIKHPIYLLSFHSFLKII